MTTFCYLNQHINSQKYIFWSIMNDFLGYFIIQIDLFRQYLIYSSLAISVVYLIVLLLIIIRGILFEINPKKTHFTLFELFVSFILKMQYIIYYPFVIQFCLILFGNGVYYFDKGNDKGINNSTLDYIVSTFGFFLQFFVKIMASYHDIEIRFKFEDKLSRPVTYYFVKQSIGETILAIAFAYKMPVVLYLFQIIQGSLAVFEYYHSHIFLQQEINKLFVCFQSSIILINLILFVDFGYLDPNLIGALILIVFTLSTKISQGIDYYKESSNYIKINPTQYLQFGDVEYYIRSIWNYSSFGVSEYLSNWVGVHFESLKQQHYLRCKKNNCFCLKFLEMEDQDDIQQEFVERGKFFKQNVLNVFQLYLQSKNRLSQPKNEGEYNVLRFSYLAYMIDVLENPLISLPYITKLNNLQFNPREQIILFLLQQQVNMRFSKIVFRKERTDWSQVIYFDKSLLVLQQKMIEIFQKFKQLIALMGLDYFSLKVLQDKIQDIRILQNEVEQLIFQLFNFNQNNRKILEFISVYLNYFDFRRKTFKKHLNTQTKSFYKEKDFLALITNSCIIFSSLLKPLGIVKSFTTNTKTILEDIQINDLVGQNCSLMIPKQIAIHHERILRNFIENGKAESIEIQENSQNKIQQNRKNLFFFCNQNNFFIQPMRMLFQINQISLKDFGICSLISRDVLMNDYILLDIVQSKSARKMYQMTHMTKRLFNSCLKKIYKNDQQIQNMDIMLMIPEAMILMPDYIAEVQQNNKQQQFASNISTIMFYPINEQQIPIFKLEKIFHNPQVSVVQLYKELCNEEDIGVCEIEVTWDNFYIRSTNSFVYFIEILKFKPIKKYSERIITVNQFRTKLQNIYNIELFNLEEICGFQQTKSVKQKNSIRQSIIQSKVRISQLSNQNIQNNPHSQQSDLKLNEHSSQNTINQNQITSIMHNNLEDNNINTPNSKSLIENTNKYFQENQKNNNTNEANTTDQLQQIAQKILVSEEQQSAQQINDFLKKQTTEDFGQKEINLDQNIIQDSNNQVQDDQKNQKEFSFMNFSVTKMTKSFEHKQNSFSFQSFQKQKTGDSSFDKKKSLPHQEQNGNEKGTNNHQDAQSDCDQQSMSSQRNPSKSQLNLMIYSSSFRKIEEQEFKSKKNQGQFQLQNIRKISLQASIEQSEQIQQQLEEYNQTFHEQDIYGDKYGYNDNLFQIDVDFNDYFTDVNTQTNKISQKSKSQKKHTELQIKQLGKHNLDLSLEEMKALQSSFYFQSSQLADQSQVNNLKANFSLINNQEQEHEKQQDEVSQLLQISQNQLQVQNQTNIPSKKSDHLIGGISQQKKIIRSSMSSLQQLHSCPFSNYVPQLNNQYTEYQTQEIINSNSNQYEDLIKKKIVQQKYYNSNQHFKQFNMQNPQRTQSVINYLVPDQQQSIIDNSVSQIQNSQKFSNNEIEDEEGQQTEILSEQFIEEFIKEHNIDNTSATSSRNEINQKKKRIINLIYSPFNLTSLDIIKFLSLALLCGLLLVVIRNYMIIKNDINKCKEDTIDIKKLGDLLLYESFQVQSKTFSWLEEQYLFQSQQQIAQNEFAKIQQDQIIMYGNYSLNVQELHSLSKDSSLLQKILSVCSNMKDYFIESIQSTQKQYFLYGVVKRIESYYQYLKKNILINEEYQINLNFLTLSTTVVSIQNSLYNQLNKSLASTLDSLLLAFILSILMSVFNVFILMPIHIIGIKIVEDQLKICSHFSKEKLQQLYIKISKQIQQFIQHSKENDQVKSPTKNQNFFLGHNIQWKKKSSSQTDKLQYLDFKFIFFVIILFALLTVYPLFNYVYGTKFINQLLQIINIIQNLEQSRICILINSGVLNLKVYSLASNYTITDNQYDSVDFKQQLNQFQHETFNNQTLYLQKMKQISSYFKDDTLIMHDELKTALLNPLQNNICNYLSSSFFNNQTMSQQECPNSFNQYLQKGLIFLITDLYQQQDSILTSLDLLQAQSSMKEWLVLNNFPSYFLKQRIVNYIYFDLSLAIQNSVKDMIDHVILLQQQIRYIVINQKTKMANQNTFQCQECVLLYQAKPQDQIISIFHAMQQPDNEHKFQKERIQNFFNQVSKFHHDMVANVNLQINNLIKEVTKRMIQIKHLNYKLIEEWVMINKKSVDEKYINNIHQMKTMQGLSRLIIESNDLEYIKQYYDEYVAQAVQIDSLQNIQYRKENVDFFKNYIQHFENQILFSFENNFQNLALNFFKKQTRLNLKQELDNISKIFIQQEVNYYEHMTQIVKDINKNIKAAEYAQINNNNNNINAAFQGQQNQGILNNSSQQPFYNNNKLDFHNNQSNNCNQNVVASKANPLIQRTLLSQVAEKQAYRQFFPFNQFNSDSQTNYISQGNINEKANQVSQQSQQQIYMRENIKQQQLLQQRNKNTFHDKGYDFNPIQTEFIPITHLEHLEQPTQLTPLNQQQQQQNKLQQNEIEHRNNLLNNYDQQVEQGNSLNQNINIDENSQQNLQQQSLVVLSQEIDQSNQNEQQNQIDNNLILNSYENQGDIEHIDETVKDQNNLVNKNDNIQDPVRKFENSLIFNNNQSNLPQSVQNNTFPNKEDHPFQSVQNNPLQNQQNIALQTEVIYLSQNIQNNSLQSGESANNNLTDGVQQQQIIEIINEKSTLPQNNQKQFIEKFFSLQQDQAEEILNIVQLQLDGDQTQDRQVQPNQNKQDSYKDRDGTQQIYSIEQHNTKEAQIHQDYQIQCQDQQQIIENVFQSEKQLLDNQNQIQVENQNQNFKELQQIQQIQLNEEQLIDENEDQNVSLNSQQIVVENPNNQVQEKDINLEQHAINSQMIAEVEINVPQNSPTIQENQETQQSAQQTMEEEFQSDGLLQKQSQQDDLDDCLIYEKLSEITGKESEIRQKQKNKSQQKQKFKLKFQEAIKIDEDDDETEKKQSEKIVIEDAQADQIFFTPIINQEKQNQSKKTVKKQITNELQNIQEEDLLSNFQEKITSDKSLKLQEEHDTAIFNQNCKYKQSKSSISHILKDDKVQSNDLLNPTQIIAHQENSLNLYDQNVNDQINNDQEVKAKKTQSKMNIGQDQKDQKNANNQSFHSKQQQNDTQLCNKNNKNSEIPFNFIEDFVTHSNNNMIETNNNVIETSNIIQETQQQEEQQTIQIDQLFSDDKQLFAPIQNSIQKTNENVQSQFAAKKIIITKKSMINESVQKIQKPKHVKLNIVKIQSVKAGNQSQQNQHNYQDDDIINKSLNLSFWEKDVEKTDLNFNFCKKYIPSKQPLANNNIPKNYYIN
ncbi:hypothetical protein ABPG72_004946 [Tetrahymena utriculariae]